MATHAGRLIRDQNLNVHYKGVPIGGKTNVSKAQKKGEIGGRKVLNDISNSGKPSALQASRKHNSMNVISVGEDLGVSKTTFSIGGKTNVSKAPDKSQVGGRKALSDLTNSVKPSVHRVSRKSQDKKLIAVPEEENFLHNHQECIKVQRKIVDMDYFLKTVGLDDDISVQLASPQGLPISTKLMPESPVKLLEMEEISEMMIEYQHCRKIENSEHNSPFGGSPKSPKLHMHSKDYYNLNFVLTDTPKLPKN